MQKTKTEKIALKCQECGKKFKRSPARAYDVECPKCHGVDIDIDYGD